MEIVLRSDARYRRELAESVLLEVNLYGRYASSEARRDRAATFPPAQASKVKPLLPTQKRFLEAAAAVIVFAVSAVAVGHLLLRGEEHSHRVLSGELWVHGAPAASLAEGEAFEVRGSVPVTLKLQDGSHVLLSPGSAGAIRGEEDGARQVFELRRGSGAFRVIGGSGTFRVSTPAGLVWGTGAEFSVDLRPLSRRIPRDAARRPELAVAVLAGSVQVESWGMRDSVLAAQNRTFGPAPAPEPPGGIDYSKLLDQAAFTLSDAIDRALARASGVPVRAVLEDEDGKVAFAVELAHEGKVREIDLDVKTGAVLEDDSEEGEDQSRLVAALKLTLQGAIEKALQAVPGRAVEAEFELKGDKARAEVKILTDGGLREVKLDGETGAILKSGANEERTEKK